MPEPTTRTPTHYDILGVRPTASPQQIRRAFRDLSKLYHPDTTELPAVEATEKFQQLNEAYGVLSSPDRRWTYDKQVGYSRISVMQPLEPLSRSQSSPRRKEVSNLYLDPNDRPLSAGEIFALFILGLTFMACLALVLTISFTQGESALNPLEAAASERVEMVGPVPQAGVTAPPDELTPTLSMDPSQAASSSISPAETPSQQNPPPTDKISSPNLQSPAVPPMQSTWL